MASVVSDSLRPYGLQPARLLCPWDSPGKNTGVGCHFLLQCRKVKSESEVAQSGPWNLFKKTQTRGWTEQPAGQQEERGGGAQRIRFQRPWGQEAGKVNIYVASILIRNPWNLTQHKCRAWLLTESRSVVSDSLRPHGLYSPWNSPGQNTGVSSRSLLQGIFPTQGSNQGLLHCRQILYKLSYQGSPS